MGSRDDAAALIDNIVAAYNSRDTDALAAFYDSDVTYWSAIGGSRHGIDAVREHIEHLHETLPDEKMNDKTVITDGEMIVAEFESTGTNAAGDDYLLEFTEVFELQGGAITSIKVYLDPEEVERVLG